MDSKHSSPEQGESHPVTADGGSLHREQQFSAAGFLPYSIRQSPAPFVWQLDRRLLLLDEEASQWVFAELEFDSELNRYVEIRRAAYESEREAVGVLLSRALASGMSAVANSAKRLNEWLLKHYGHSIQESRPKRGSHVH